MGLTQSPNRGLTIFNLGCFALGITFMTVGIHYSYKNVAPQQARAKARSELLRAHLTKRFGEDVIPEVFRNPPHSISDSSGSASDAQPSSGLLKTAGVGTDSIHYKGE
ncbi:hypothetical protein MKW98_002135 [Papaver atlanticum]|uniref:Uncharacterized protein n=1 Tax=Papaver atlanticum TaxID=357466 RepID=A0AAD4X2N4_9MAGN|nr:hypothetical protein MKW98_002135 [Papaver atlanticum]